VKTLSAVVCLALVGVLPVAWKFDQQRENQKMNHTETPVKFIKSETLPPSPGYSQAATVSSGRLIYVAGQVAMDRSGKLVGPRDFRAQAEQTFENLKAALAASGASFSNVVKLNSYFVDIKQVPVYREVRDKYINVSLPPVSTAVEVRRLVREEWLLEVEAIAVVPE
jgi:enamine deaminase RidA (YjgF/YER057c/UK114 family)